MVLESYPNPATDEVRLSFTLEQGMSLSVAVYDLSGKQVYSRKINRLSVGTHTLTIPMEQRHTGIR